MLALRQSSTVVAAIESGNRASVSVRRKALFSAGPPVRTSGVRFRPRSVPRLNTPPRKKRHGTYTLLSHATATIPHPHARPRPRRLSQATVPVMDLSAHAASLPNLRDLTALTPHLTPRLVYRSAAPAPASPDALRALRIAVVFDLRSETELARALVVVPPPAGVTRLHVPVFARDDYTPEAIALRYAAYASTDTVAGFVQAYRAILRAGGPAFAPVLRHVAQPATTPCLVHCTAGKDRTGVLCALMLSLCGVDDDTIAREYALTEEGLRSERAHIVARLKEAPALNGDAAAAERMLSSKYAALLSCNWPRWSGVLTASRPESMLATLKVLREEYGSVEGYVVNVCGLSNEEIAGIRHNLGADIQASASKAP